MSVKVLIIDDDEDDRELFSYALSNVSSDVTCVEAVDGEDGLRLLRENGCNPDYIFLDLNMPRVDGILFLEKMRRDRRLSDIPVIIYTTSKFQNDKEKCVELGAVHFITKPTTISEIESAISFVLERKWEPIIH
ncbi:MAG TPA: response regulator [Chryseolinea sp.]|nr:response regulator [Chryseolinea sp.]